MENDKTIVAIELGSSKISGVAGQIQYDGSLRVMAYASVPSSSCIRHGAVYNLDKTANAIAEVVERLNTILSTKIEKVYVGYNAKGLKSVIGRVEHRFDEETVVNQEVLDDMFQQCSEIEYDGYVNLFQESQEYVVDNKRGTETDPMGVACRSLEGNYLNILLKKQVADYIAQCFMAAQVEIIDGYVAPMVQADAVLTDDDRQQGCVLVDYGADTTTVSVYKNGLLRFLRVIPLGSALITRDLSAILKIEMEQAEQLKCTYGLCNLIGSQDNRETIVINDRKLSLNEIGEIIEARNEEIIRNVINQIKASGYSEVLYAGMVLTGGGSQLRQLDHVLKDMMPSMRQPRIATEPACGVVWNEIRWKRGDGSQLALLSVMAKGDENCCVLKPMDEIDKMAPEDQDKVVQQSLFTEEGESAQEERDRKEQEERRQAEETAVQNEENKKDEEKARSAKKKPSVFKRWYDSFMNMGENFFDDKDEAQQNVNNGN
ncbi:MAG: cell division protein FtsA [Bacteroidaceae bacterium]|nr:cell division protein FtsA [Bacteroidaceae bacterium]MBP5347913.1 cell division protein FtsA [Bacteroidaceae bacterium]